MTRNRPWFQMTARDMIVGDSVLITEPQQLKFYPDINAVLLGKDSTPTSRRAPPGRST